MLDFRHARRAQKIVEVRAVPARPGERVDTIMRDGHVETTNSAQPGDMKVTNPSGEQYLVQAFYDLNEHIRFLRHSDTGCRSRMLRVVSMFGVGNGFIPV